MHTFMIRLVVLAAFAATGALVGCGKSEAPPAAAADVSVTTTPVVAETEVIVEVTEAEHRAFAAEAAAEITPDNAEARANALLEEIMADE